VPTGRWLSLRCRSPHPTDSRRNGATAIRRGGPGQQHRHRCPTRPTDIPHTATTEAPPDGRLEQRQRSPVQNGQVAPARHGGTGRHVPRTSVNA
jgi:hypothetical protein